MRIYDAVLLDLYDTFVWSEWSVWQRAMAERLGVKTATVERAFSVTRPARTLGEFSDAAADLAAVVRAAGVEPDPSLLDDLLVLERGMLEGDIHLYDDSIPVVRELRARGVKTVLVSNCSRNTRGVVDRLGLEDEFDAVILSFEARAMKPQPEIYRLGLERAGDVEPARAVFVDDQPRYCDGAAVVGMDTYLILRANEDVPAQTNGHRTITTLEALLV